MEKAKYQIEVNANICKGCGYCKEVCNKDVFATADKFNSQGYKPNVAVHSENCVGCLRCVYICPDFAINLKEAC